MSYITNGHTPISYLSLVYVFAKILELLIHRLGSPKCVFAGISGCSDIFCHLQKFHMVIIRWTGTFRVKYIFIKLELLFCIIFFILPI